MNARKKHLLIAVAIFFAEILVATRFSSVQFVRSYLSDFLAVILVYHFVKVFRDIPPATLAASVFIFACSIEILQYFHLVDVLGLRPGSLLRILIGTSFSWGDMLAYFLGCLTAYFTDLHFLWNLGTRSS